MKIKKRNLFLLVLITIIIFISIFLYKLHPIFIEKTKTYYHQNIINEINHIALEIEIPENYIKETNNMKSINTNLLNKWIININQHFINSIENIYESSIPLGYFTGIFFLQSTGPKLSFEYLIENRTLCSYDIKTTSLGINNALIELILNIQCVGIIFIGFEKIEINIHQTLPISLDYIEGNVPQFFPY